jgi:hypothetical protein
VRRIDLLGLEIDDSGAGGVGCKNWITSKSFGPLKGRAFGKVDVTVGATLIGSGSRCCISCSDGTNGYLWSGKLEFNAGVELGISTLRIYERFQLFDGRIFGSIDGWFGLRLFGGLKGIARVSLTYNTCTKKYALGGDIAIAGYVGIEGGGELTADGFLDAGWFGEYDFKVGLKAKAVGRLTGYWRPTLSCDINTCSLRGPYTNQLEGFIDVGGSIKGHNLTRRYKLGDTGEMPGAEHLGWEFPNPVGVPPVNE